MSTTQIALPALLLAGLLMSACSSEVDRVRHQFLKGCMAAGAPEALCQCSLREMSKGKTDDELLSLIKSPRRRQEASALMLKATAICSHKG